MINTLVDEARLVEEYEGIYLPFAAEIEKSLSAFFVRAGQAPFAKKMEIDASEVQSLSKGQAEAVHSVLTGRVCALTADRALEKQQHLRLY